MYNVISTGSHGNSIIYHGCIMVDIGVSFSAIKPFIDDLKLVLISHIHSDHINHTTLKKLVKERPTLRVGCGEWMKESLDYCKNLDIYESGILYNYTKFQISPVTLYHEVECFGFRIFKDGHKTIHITDTAHVQGITAKGYDLFAIEHNYDEDTIYEKIAEAESQGKFSHQRRSINTHLSDQQAIQFILENASETSKVLHLHQSKHK